MKHNPDKGRRGGARKGSAKGRKGTGATPSKPGSFKGGKPSDKPGAKPGPKSGSKPARGRHGRPRPQLKFAPVPDSTATMRLNRYIAQSGVCSRREADVMITAGVVNVNGKVITELGHKVDPTKDTVRVEGDTIRPEPMRYVLINKPKNFLAVDHDPSGRRTIGDLIKIGRAHV